MPDPEQDIPQIAAAEDAAGVVDPQAAASAAGDDPEARENDAEAHPS